jgi:cobalt-zinc-cadmium efflux system protein
MAEHGTHSHSHGAELNDLSTSRLVWAVAINLGLTLVEVVVGVMAGSLMLLADALHNFSDGGALVVALIARRISRRSADERFTFGYRRAELVGAIVNLTTLIVIGLYLIYEAIVRLTSPNPVAGGPVMVAAGLALALNLFTVLLLRSMARGSLNVRAAFVHHLADALSSLAVLLGGGAIALWGWSVLDPILTIAIAVYILIHGSSMFRQAATTLMNASPPEADVARITRALCGCADVVNVHHVHVWELHEGEQSLEAHVVIERHDAGEIEEIKRRIKTRLRDDHGIGHSTLEFEFDDEGPRGECADETEMQH